MPKRESADFCLADDSLLFTEQLQQFVETVFTAEKISQLFDIVRDPIALDQLRICLKTYLDKDAREWNGNEDRTPFGEIKHHIEILESKMRQNKIFLTIQPYSHFLDIVCFQIANKLHSIEQDLNKIGVTIPLNTFDKLSEGPSHEAFHYLRYLSFDNSATVQGRLDLLKNGSSRLGEHIKYNIEMTFVLVDGKLDFEMSCRVPQGFGLEEQLQIYLAPIHPSVGDALLACTEIIRWGNTEHPLYREMTEFLLEVMDEVFSRDDMPPEKNHQMIISSIKDLDSDWYIWQVLHPKLKPLGKAFTDETIKKITQFVPKDFGVIPK
jgi:hypothetical protein